MKVSSKYILRAGESMKFDSILGTIWLDASPDALIGISYTPIDESPLAN